jgi:hypothetical protein
MEMRREILKTEVFSCRVAARDTADRQGLPHRFTGSW